MKRVVAFLKRNHAVLITVAAVGAAYLLMSLLGIGCPIKTFLGISCPGCGMSRACLCALRLDFEAAFFYHPLWVWMPVAAGLLILFRLRRAERAFWAVVYLTAGLLCVVYLYRLLFTASPVVSFAPAEGWVYRFFTSILAGP